MGEQLRYHITQFWQIPCPKMKTQGIYDEGRIVVRKYSFYTNGTVVEAVVGD